MFAIIYITKVGIKFWTKTKFLTQKQTSTSKTLFFCFGFHNTTFIAERRIPSLRTRGCQFVYQRWEFFLEASKLVLASNWHWCSFNIDHLRTFIKRPQFPTTTHYPPPPSPQNKNKKTRGKTTKAANCSSVIVISITRYVIYKLKLCLH